MHPLKNLSVLMKIFSLLVVGLFAFALIKVTISTTAQSSKSKRQLDNRVPEHLPIKVKIKKEKEESFQDLENEHWARDFELEVKNTGDRPIYALSLVWVLTEVKMPDGNPYGATLKYGRSEFITVPGETPKPEDVPIKPGETYVFKLSKPTVENWESWARDNKLTPPKSVLVFFNFLCFGDGTGWEGPQGQNFHRKKSVAFYSPNRDPAKRKQQSKQRDPSLQPEFSIVPVRFWPAFFVWRLCGGLHSLLLIFAARGLPVQRSSGNLEGVTVQTLNFRQSMTWSLVSQRAVPIRQAFVEQLSL